MWQTIISIDKKFKREYSFIIDSLNRIEGIAYAIEETKNRHHINVASNEENLKRIKPLIENVIVNTILIYIKYDYLSNKIHFNNESYLNSALISALVYCDRNHESDIVKDSIKDCSEYSIDALFRFRMNELISNWNEVVVLVNGLIHSNHTASDIYSLIEFILEMSEDEKCILKITRKDEEVIIHNITKNSVIEIPKLSEANHTNIITAIISANPYEIQLEKELLNNEIVSVVNNIAKLKTL